jgi:hypothetical protein
MSSPSSSSAASDDGVSRCDMISEDRIRSNSSIPLTYNKYSSAGTTTVSSSKRNPSNNSSLDCHRSRKRFRTMQDAFRSLSFGTATTTTVNDENNIATPHAARKQANNIHSTTNIFSSPYNQRGSSDQITYLDPTTDGHTIFDDEEEELYFEEDEQGTVTFQTFSSINPTTTTTTTIGGRNRIENDRTHGGGLLRSNSSFSTEDEDKEETSQQQSDILPTSILPPILQKEKKKQFVNVVDTKIEDIIRRSRLQASLQQQQQQNIRRHKLLNHQGKLVSTLSQDDFRLQHPPPPPPSYLPRQRSNSFSDYSTTNDAEEMMIIE